MRSPIGTRGSRSRRISDIGYMTVIGIYMGFPRTFRINEFARGSPEKIFRRSLFVISKPRNDVISSNETAAQRSTDQTRNG